jgi:hypothetical protein
MPAPMATASVLMVGLAASGGLGWLQWLILKRLVRQPNSWMATSVIGAAVSTPLSTTMLLETLVRAGLPAAATLPVGLGLLAGQLALGTLMVAVVAWGTRHAA